MGQLGPGWYIIPPVGKSIYKGIYISYQKCFSLCRLADRDPPPPLGAPRGPLLRQLSAGAFFAQIRFAIYSLLPFSPLLHVRWTSLSGSLRQPLPGLASSPLPVIPPQAVLRGCRRPTSSPPVFWWCGSGWRPYCRFVLLGMRVRFRVFLHVAFGPDKWNPSLVA